MHALPTYTLSFNDSIYNFGINWKSKAARDCLLQSRYSHKGYNRTVNIESCYVVNIFEKTIQGHLEREVI